MATTVPSSIESHDSRSKTALASAATSWFAVAVVGQWLFATYILALYGRATLSGDASAWTRVMPNGRVPGDIIGNAALTSHVLLAVIIMVGGPLQLVPKLRARYRAFHRWTGRAYILSAVTISLGGLFLVWARGSEKRFVQHIGISIDGLLVLAFAWIAFRTARSRDFTAHRQWALRLFVVSSGVWFFRVGVFLSLLLNQGPFGFDPKTFDGPFLQVMSFADYLVPLAVLEGYFAAQRRGAPAGRFAMAAVLAVMTLLTAAGVFAVFMGNWRSHIFG